jgi:hypothetical protein
VGQAQADGADVGVGLRAEVDLKESAAESRIPSIPPVAGVLGNNSRRAGRLQGKYASTKIRLILEHCQGDSAGGRSRT